MEKNNNIYNIYINKVSTSFRYLKDSKMSIGRSYRWNPLIIWWSKCDALRSLVPFVQSKKREKHPWRSVTFSSKVARLSNTPPWLFFTFQIAQRPTNILQYSKLGNAANLKLCGHWAGFEFWIRHMFWIRRFWNYY